MRPRWGAYALLFFDKNNEKGFVAIVGMLDSEPWAHVITSFRNYKSLEYLLVSECIDREKSVRIVPCVCVSGDLPMTIDKSVKFQLEKLLLGKREPFLQLLVLGRGL
jgi:hypothetical protein